LRIPRLICFFLLTLFLYACGIEDYPVIYPVPQSNISQEMNDRAIVRVPNYYAGTTFTNFAIFYRIYVSDTPQSSITESIYSTINSTLASDYNAIKPYIDSTSIVNTNMDTLFQNRGYKYLDLQDDNIFSVLSSSVLGTNIEFDFSSSRGAPTMRIGSQVYTLWRSNSGGLYNPRPDRLFINMEELWRSENINATTNADVVDKSDITSDARHYTYAAMFIVAVGVNAATYTNIYSTPALIHVFQLPDR